MKVAIVHYWLVSMRGGEKVVEELCRMYPEADIFTLVCDPQSLSPTLRGHKITTSFLQSIPGAVKHYKQMLPLMPFALESFDLSAYDLVISSESGPAKGVIPRPDALHVCYCHTPMRYLWDHYHAYRAEAGPIGRMVMPMLGPFLRQWDVTTAARVDAFVSNSAYVGRRIHRFYNREATVIHPPVAVDDFAISREIDDAYLCAGQLVGYKRVDVAVRAFTAMGKRLVVIGEGEQSERLKAMAGPTIRFLGRQSFESLKTHLSRCRALIFPGEEDFGIVPVEAMASGRPVIAFGRGGVRETVVDGRTGCFFDEQTPEALIAAVQRFEAMEARFRPEALRQHAGTFASGVFRAAMSAFLEEKLESRRVRPFGMETGIEISGAKAPAPIPLFASAPVSGAA